MIYVFDLDGTICLTEGRDYAEAVPLAERIAAVNALFDAGHTIIIVYVDDKAKPANEFFTP